MKKDNQINEVEGAVFKKQQPCSKKVYIYIYIYREREREREKDAVLSDA